MERKLKELQEINRTNEALIKVLVVLAFSLALYLIATEVHYKRIINTYENTMIETDYCNDDFSECHRTYETFKDYYKENANKSE